MTKNQRGFSVVETLLILIIVGVLGFTGWYIWHNKNQIDKSIDNTNDTANWKLVTSSKETFSIRIPDGWRVINNSAEDNLVAFTANDMIFTRGTPATIDSREIGGSDNIWSFQLFVTDKSYRGWKDGRAIKSEFGPVDGVIGTRYYQKYNKGDPLGISNAQGGEQAYEYEFAKGEKIYRVAYFVNPGEVNQVDIVEKALMTLRFR